MSFFNEFLKLDIDSLPLKVVVIGDAMIDEYFNVSIKKISPEFPIPVMHSDHEVPLSLPGGAANVAYQFKNFNVKPYLISFIDDDFFRCFSKNLNLSFSKNIQIDSNLKIPRKKRFYNEDFPTYRWDVEAKNYGMEVDKLEKSCESLLQNAKRQNFDITIFSDYNKGIFYKNDQLINDIIKKSKVSIVDSKVGDLKKWKGCSVFKPNLQEALSLSGCSDVKEAGRYLRRELECQAVVITKSGDGVSIFTEEEEFEIIPERKSLAESVIGAGDCFTAFLAMCLGRGLDIKFASNIAWKAGSIYVKSKHNKPISRVDLLNGKIIEKGYEDFFLNRENRDFKLSFSNGCFDLLHVGHIASLEFAKSKSDKLVVAVNTDESVSRLKQGRPIIPLDQRMRLLAGLDCVDFVIQFDEDTPLNIIKKIQPDVLTKGQPYKKEEVIGFDIVPETYIGETPNVYTSDIIKKCQGKV
ncbi:MAG: bifunctional heptose 7-phosphate kinase/heptose 1-phosphate adenyltransferase [Neisseriaceae bacterium]|nr:MAG: bifunctional heptose 7-phosphate kinase/heptose 1-phosphate adenyltransferase [Neisseriaceae bacterium]